MIGHCLSQTARLFVIATGLGIFCNWARSDDPLPWITVRDPAAAAKKYRPYTIKPAAVIARISDRTAAIVDSRTEPEFSAGHFSEAINIPAADKEQYLRQIFIMLPRQGLIVIYSDSHDKQAAYDLFEFLKQNGFSEDNLRIFTRDWKLVATYQDLVEP